MEFMTQLPSNGLTILDCYCGAGVGAIGAEMAGFKTVYAFDNNKHAVRNYNTNIANGGSIAHVVDARTLDISTLPNTDIITGGFPCKPWSCNGKGEGESCEKNGNLAQVLIDIILLKEPKGFLIENVKGLVDKKNKPYFEAMVKQLEKSFDVSWQVLDCSEYGVPQKRERVFIVGTHKILCKTFNFPLKSNVKYSIKNALQGLTEAPDGVNNHELNEKWTIRNDEKPFVHKVPKGGNWKSLPEQDQKTFMKGAFNSGGGRTGYLAVMDDTKPARTIMSTPMGKNTVQILRLSDGSSRRYTVRESLRLQSVPDSWGFDSDTPVRVQYERCSGIPSLMSYKLMEQVAISLR